MSGGKELRRGSVEVVSCGCCARAGEIKLQRFAEEDGAFGNLEAEGVVDVLGEGVGDGCVGGEFAAAL